LAACRVVLFRTKVKEGLSLNSVLVLDATQRSALSVARSLSSSCNVVVADIDPGNICSVSSGVSACERYSAPADHEAFLSDINRIIKKYDIKVLYPTTEITVYTLLEHKGRLVDVHLPFPELNNVHALSDKGSLVKLCERLNISVPKSEYFQNAAELLSALKPYHYPVVLKPTLSRIKTESEWISTSVTYAYSEEEMCNIVKEQQAFRDHPFMLQEYIDGHGSGVFLLYDKGKCIAHFAHKRLREKPPTGGVSVLSESIEVDPVQLSAAKQLLDEVQWHGVAMVEFKVDKNGKPFVIEVNPRFWGSLQLAIDSGVDFPLLLHKATMGEPYDVVTEYRVGQKLRWLLGDFDRLYLVLKSPQYSFSEKLIEVLKFLVPYSKGMRYEVNRLSDFKPFWAELKLYIKALRD
jgi:predicted ATP-grasp superfamily ATP-dependent carboligase